MKPKNTEWGRLYGQIDQSLIYRLKLAFVGEEKTLDFRKKKVFFWVKTKRSLMYNNGQFSLP